MIRDFFRTLAPWAWAVTAAVVLAIVLLALSYCTAKDRAETEAATARAGSAVAEGQAAAGADAVEVVTGNAAKSSEIDARVKDSEDAIRNADPDERDSVTVRELCNGPDGRRRPGC